MMRKGFTLIELIISLGLAGIILTVTTAIFVSVVNKNTLGSSRERLEQFKNDSAVEFANAIKWGSKFVCDSCDSSSNATLTVNDNTQYFLSNGQLIKKDIPSNTQTPLNSNQITINSFKITAYTTAVDSNGQVYPSYKISLDIKTNSGTVIQDSVNIVVSNRKQSIVL